MFQSLIGKIKTNGVKIAGVVIDRFQSLIGKIKTEMSVTKNWKGEGFNPS